MSPAHDGSTDPRPVRVLLADDQTLVRAGFRLVLERDPAIRVVAEADDGARAVDLTRLHRPDVVLMDVRMPEVDGIEATRRILAEPSLAGVRIVVLTTYEFDEYIVDAIEAGASGFLLKDVEPEELRRAVHVAVAGDGLLSPTVTTRVIAALREHAAQRPSGVERLAVLTDREREVVALVGRGMNNVEIGRQLHMSPATAKTHVGRAMTKLAARDRVQLALIAHETGLHRT
ncbi:response regulator [Egicoccus sp. AB-alg2]|uniref:response regulator n=1 Tax=Egicoccus sp. AB-alg2 TaxID=3242693 RepID=UPI00359EACE4